MFKLLKHLTLSYSSFSLKQCAVVPTGASNQVMQTREQRVHSNFEELLQDYLYMRMPLLPGRCLFNYECAHSCSLLRVCMSLCLFSS